MAYNSSSIDASVSIRILDNSVDIRNDMIREQKNLKREINELILNWRGGGRGKNSSLLISLRASNSMYSNMALVIAYGMQMIAAIKVASNTLYKTYSGENEDLFA